MKCKYPVFDRFLILAILTALVFVHPAGAAEIHSAGKKQVMLTIDDGPKATHTDEMLAVLKDKGVKATFFLLGKDVQERPDDVKKIADAGHVIANHAYSHESLKGMSYEKIVEELESCNSLLEKITGKRPRYMRPPHGEYDDTVLQACKDLGLTVVFWTNNPGDYKREPTKVVADRVIRNRGDGDIILVHLGLQNTVEALPRIIDAYKKAGFKFVTADEVKPKKASLTFDDGPKERFTEELLAVLSEKKVKAAFFLLGVDVAARPDDAKKIINSGHIIANHSMTHANLKKMSFDAVRAELKNCNDILISLGAPRPRFMRPPGGQFNETVLKACEAENLTPIFWTNNPGDYKEWNSASALADKVIKAYRDDDIILLHLGLEKTVQALPIIIDTLRNEGVEFVQLKELSSD